VVERLLAADPRTRGRVLDAGTGSGYMTALLARLAPGELVSVGLDENSFAAARARLPAGALACGRVRFVLGDLAAPDLVEAGAYDLVVGDYLIAAVAGHRPFRELEVLAGLWRAVAPGGLLVLTGMEPFAPCRSPEEEVVREILRWREAAAYLGGRETYREAPARWVVARLEEIIGRDNVHQDGRRSRPELFWSEPLVWTLDDVRRLAASAVRHAGLSPDRVLESFVRRRLDTVLRRAARLGGFGPPGGRVTWSRDWIVRVERS